MYHDESGVAARCICSIFWGAFEVYGSVKCLLFLIYVGRKHWMRNFDGSEGHCKELYSVIEQGNAEIFEQRRILDDALLSEAARVVSSL